MTTKTWLSSAEFSEIAGVNRSVGSRILKAAHNGKPWRGVMLTVRKSAGRGPGGERFEVDASSLPPGLVRPLSSDRNAISTNCDSDASTNAESRGADRDSADTGNAVIGEERQSENNRAKQKEANLAKYAQLPERKRDRAKARLEVLNLCGAYIAQNGLGRSRGEETFAHEYLQGRIEASEKARNLVKHLSARTLRAWFTAEREQGMYGLADNLGSRKGRSKLDAHPEIQQEIIGLILTKTSLRPNIVHEYLVAKYPDQAKDFSPKTVKRFISRWRKDNDQLYAKLTDPDRWKSQYKVAFGSQSEAITALNQLWSLDDTKADILCTDGRHSAVFLIDIYSRRTKILIVKTVDAIAVGTLLRLAIIAWGVPLEILIDNGKTYCSTHIDGALRSLEIKKIVCTPFASEEKGVVERVQGTFQRDLLELLPGFVGHNVSDRQRIRAKRAFGQRSGDPLETFEVCMTGAELQAFANDWCENRYQHRAQSGLQINPSTGTHFTPWERATAWHEPVRKVEERALDVLLLMAGEIRTVTKKGVLLDRARYIHSYLIPHIGKRVIVRPDPEDMGKAIVHTAENHEFICVAESADRSGISLKERATEAAIAQKQFLKQARETVAEARKAAKKENPVQRILQRDREAMAKVAAFPHRAVPHSSPAIEEAIAAAEDLREIKQAKRERAATQKPARRIEPEPEILSNSALRLRIYYMLRRSFGPHEIEFLNRWYPQGAREDQVGEIVKRLTAQQSSPEPTQQGPAIAGMGEE